MAATDWTTIENAIQAWVAQGSGFPATNVVWGGQNKGRAGSPFIRLRIIAFGPIGFDETNITAVPLVASYQPTVVDTTQDAFTVVAHGRATGDGPFQATTNGVLPGGLALTTNYWFVKVDDDHFRLSPSFLGSIDPSPTIVDITTAGSGQLTLSSTADTEQLGKEIRYDVVGSRFATLSIQCFAAEGAATGDPAPLAVLGDVITACNLPDVHDALYEAGVAVAGFNGAGRTVDAVVQKTVWEPRGVIEADLFMTAALVAWDTYIARFTLTPTIDGVQYPELDFDTE